MGRTDLNESGRGRAASNARYRYFVAWYLALVYTFNFMDRQILSILQEPIKRELALSDTQLGLLSGLIFALFYTTCGIPVAWLADRFRRVTIMAVACGVWSIATIGSGFAGGFGQIAAMRVLVGAGEAGGSPPSYSLLSDYFPPERRASALAIYSLGVPLGSALGAFVGAWVASRYGWRMAFFVVGSPGLLLALLLYFGVREPARGATDPVPLVHSGPEPSIRDAVVRFFTNRTLVLTAISSGLSAFVGYAMLSWNPSFLVRIKGMTLGEVAIWYSLALGGSGLMGTFISGWLVDRLARRSAGWYALLPAIAFLLTLPGVIGAILAPTWQLTLLCLAVPGFLTTMYLAPALAVAQNQAPPRQRAVTGAILLFVLNLVGLGGGPVYMGTISDLAQPYYGNRSLLVAYACLLPFIVLTAGVHLLAARSLKRSALPRAT